MSEFEELIERLRSWSKDMRLFGNADQDVREAADAIEALTARAEKAEYDLATETQMRKDQDRRLEKAEARAALKEQGQAKPVVEYTGHMNSLGEEWNEL